MTDCLRHLLISVLSFHSFLVRIELSEYIEHIENIKRSLLIALILAEGTATTPQC